MEEVTALLEGVLECLRVELPLAKQCVDLVRRIADGLESEPRVACARMIEDIERQLLEEE